MYIYEVPIHVSPQIVAMLPDTQVVEIRDVQKHGQSYCPSVIFSSLLRPRNRSEEASSFIDCLLHCIPMTDTKTSQGSHAHFGDTRSYFNNLDQPLLFHESRLVHLGSFVHKYNKLTHYIYLESLYGSQSIGRAPQATQVGRGVLVEDSLTRRIQ